MAISDIYTARVAPTLASASATALTSIVAGTTVRLWVVGVRVEIGQTSAVAGNDILFQLYRAHGRGGAGRMDAPADHRIHVGGIPPDRLRVAGPGAGQHDRQRGPSPV